MQKQKFHFFRRALFSVGFLLLTASFAWGATDYQVGKYNIDPAHSRVSFVIGHFVVSEVEGRFNDVSGTITLADPFTSSSVTATVPVKTIDTGVKKRDDHLRSKDFFEVQKYPTMKLVSKKVTGMPAAFKLMTALTIKDVTKDVTFDGRYTGTVKDPEGNQRVAFQLSAQVKRKDFNINYDQQLPVGPAVGETVNIRIWVEAIKTQNAASTQQK